MVVLNFVVIDLCAMGKNLVTTLVNTGVSVKLLVSLMICTSLWASTTINYGLQYQVLIDTSRNE